MAEIKTRPVDTDVHEFIRTFANTEQKIADSFTLLKLMEEITGYQPVMWGPSIIGFGSYHYKSERSRQEGDWPLAGFSPRKAAISLYVYAGAPGQDEMLKELGKYKMGKACIYVKKLADIRQDVLIRLIQSSVDYLRKKYS
ncbi:hypothetical protein TBC1_111863 [Lentimicrobium saccharophilum]|uniref:YdhG-like domain-containing protein n=1 Tax=Lentimicrobium saccharophilum TaxID=1678841 RepID=A0A0S7BSF6_9BACT|nr:DUF1801 domain-containing protein [Lentimicrobium saccharophilum]GAP43706.1 hypothetical protein TBC1_111863 [Lentimicrobium saccharophilum]